MSNKLASIAAVVCVVLLCYGREFRHQQRDLAYYTTTYLCKQGVDIGFGTYDLRSFDAGKTWYAVDASDGKVVILGTAEAKFPGLLAHLVAWDRLFDYIKVHGQIKTFTNLEALKVLSDAGITVGHR